MYVITKKQLIITLIALLAVIACAVSIPLAVNAAYSPRPEKTIVIDAGHGGADGGVSGKTGARESDINLAVAKKLASVFENGGYRVVMTRTEDVSLSGDAKDNFKRADLNARRKIASSANALLLVSIHTNFYPSAARRGAQTFYAHGSTSSAALADSVQSLLNRDLNQKSNGRSYEALSGDFYLLNNLPIPAVIVECGFLSSPADEALLVTDAYQQKLADVIYHGIMSYILAAV